MGGLLDERRGRADAGAVGEGERVFRRYFFFFGFFFSFLMPVPLATCSPPFVRVRPATLEL